MNLTDRRAALIDSARVAGGFVVLFALTGLPGTGPAAHDDDQQPVVRTSGFSATAAPGVHREGDWVIYERVADLDLTRGTVTTVQGSRVPDGGCAFAGSRSASEPVPAVMGMEIAYNPVTCQSRVYERELTAQEAAERRSDPHAEQNAERAWWGLPPLVEETAPATYVGPERQEEP